MFLAHHAAGLALSRADARVSLGWWIGAALWLDLLWAPLLAAGVESVAIRPGATAVTPLEFLHYPWSHSLAAALVWALLAGVVGGRLTKSRTTAVALGAAVLSHWALDAVAHAPDLPLWPGGPKAGFGLWDSPFATVAFEGGFYAVSVVAYLRHTRALSKWGRWGAWSYLAFVAVIGGGSWLGAPPPDVAAITAAALAAWLFPVWAWGFDRRRQPNSSSTGA